MPERYELGPSRSQGLVDVLDRILDKGLVIAGDIRIKLADVELLTIQIRLLVCSVDKAAEILLASGLTSAFISAGSSSICAIGAPADQTSWRVEVSDPLDRSHRLDSIEIKDRSVSTSGCREKTFESGGKTYCHIMDPRIGRPIEGLLSATVITQSGVEAEALSKALMVMGVEKAGDFLKTRPHVRALLYYKQPEGGLGCARLNF